MIATLNTVRKLVPMMKLGNINRMITSMTSTKITPDQNSFSSHTDNTHRFYNPLSEAISCHNPHKYTGGIKAAILDWSGTTADAHVIAPARVFYDVFAKHGVPISMKEAREPMGLRKDLHIKKILFSQAVKKRWIRIKGTEPTPEDSYALFQDFVPMQIECLPEYTDLLPGTVEAVNEIKKMGITIGSTTGFTREMVDVLLAAAQEQGFEPDITVAGDEVENDMGFRPAPFMVYKNLVQMGIYPIQSVVKVDDTVTGVGEGLNAGCWAVGVANYSNYTDVDTMDQWNSMSEEEQNERMQNSRNILEKAHPHYVADDIRQLPEIIRDINRRMARGEVPQGHYQVK